MSAEKTGRRWSELSWGKRAGAVGAASGLLLTPVALAIGLGGTHDTGGATVSASATRHPAAGPSADRSPRPDHSPTAGASASPSRISLTTEPSTQGGKKVFDVTFSCPPGRTGEVASGVILWDTADGNPFFLKASAGRSDVEVGVDPAKRGLTIPADPKVGRNNISVGNRRAIIEFDPTSDSRGVVVTGSCGISVPSSEQSAS